MRTRSSQGPLTEEFERFQQSIRGLALAIVRSIVREEFKARIGRLKASLDTPATSRRRSRGTTRIVPATSRRRTRGTTPIVPANAPTTIVDAAPAPVQPTAAGSVGKRRWTRDAIINELATWLASGTTIDASFVTRYGPRGLVAASKKEFGRFEAALNVASLRVSKLYPDTPARSAR